MMYFVYGIRELFDSFLAMNPIAVYAPSHPSICVTWIIGLKASTAIGSFDVHSLDTYVTHIANSQGIVGCTPANVPLWEIPIHSGYLWL